MKKKQISESEIDIEAIISGNELIGKWMEIEPEIEYFVGNTQASCFHPKNCGYDWPPRQKKECEHWIKEHPEYASRNGYEVIKQEWYPWYNQDWNQLIPVVKRIDQTVFAPLNPKVAFLNFKWVVHTSFFRYDITATWQATVNFIKWLNNEQEKVGT